MGYDILIRMASGILLSLALGFSVFMINFTIGAYLGALQGYYGGVLDILFQRFTEIIGSFPFIILNTLIVQHFVQRGGLSPFWGLVVAFIIAGWIGTANLVRMQFYRFKNQEYILAARTLGANNNRLMFKHIFPNALGTIITSSVLAIPGVVFTEATLSFLGIINLDGPNVTSLGTLLANGRAVLASSPHILFFPAVVISLLMISFNLFGNGLRDAFNPSLRGTGE
jgi:oligopeptide transport system permease protein